MKWFKDLQIAQKILTFAGLVAFFIAIVGFVGYLFISKGAASMNSMYKERLLPVAWLNEASTLGRYSESNVLKLIFTKSSINREKYIKNINKASAEFKLLLNNYEALKLDPAEKENLNKLKEELAIYKSVRSKIADLALKAGDNQSVEAHEYYLNNIHVFENFNARLKLISRENELKAKNINIKNEQESKQAITLIVILIIFALISAVIAGLWMAKLISTSINEVVENLEEVAQGNLTVRNVINDSKDETGVLAHALNQTVKNLKELISSVARSIEEISANSEEMSASAEQTAIGAQQVSKSVVQLAEGSQQVSQSVNQLATGSEQVAMSISHLATGANDAAKHIESCSLGLNDINKSIQKVSSEAVVVSKLGNETETNANQGKGYVVKAVDKICSIKKVSGDVSSIIGELGCLSSDIEQIVDLIKTISGQTNLLALNAAIEAARAGEHGKGFAVVADEVKKLASQSSEATDKITGMIKEIQKKTNIAVSTMDKASAEVEEGVLVVNDTGNALESIIEQVKVANIKIQVITKDIDSISLNSDNVVKMVENVACIIDQTATSAGEMASVTEESSASAEEIASITEENSASAEEISSITQEQTASLQEISASSQTLAKVAETLSKQIAVFKI